MPDRDHGARRALMSGVIPVLSRAAVGLAIGLAVGVLLCLTVPGLKRNPRSG